MSTPVTLRVIEAHARVYRHTWRGSAISTFVNPVLFLAAMGVLLGAYVNQTTDPAELGGLDYLAFVASGLLAATAMQTGAGDGSWPVMAGIKWTKQYHAALSTPVGVVDLVLGHLAWLGIRLLLTSVVYFVVSMAFGAVTIAGAAAIPAAVLTGLAFGAPVTAFAANLEKETGLSTMFRFVIVPMFLFAGTFSPVSNLPSWTEPLVLLTPLWHGVELSRAAFGATIEGSIPVHIGYLAAWFLVGTVLSILAFRKKLVL